MNLANEGLEARKKDEEVASRKRKVQDDKVWEGMFTETFLSCVSFHSFTFRYTDSREQRVDSWRSFTKDTRKKKKTKVAILG